MARRTRKQQPALHDWHLWSAVKKSVRPLCPQAQVKPQSPGTADTVANEARAEEQAPSAQRGAARPQRAVSGPVRRLSVLPEIEPRVRRRLVRGQLPIDATLDLHGMRQAEARAALHRFVKARAARGDRTILVITGKGIGKLPDGTVGQRGVLRTMLPLWLSDPGIAGLIAGFEVSARPHGGEGAFYVRLRRVAK